MDLKVVARLADQASKQSDLDMTITTARRGATPEAASAPAFFAHSRCRDLSQWPGRSGRPELARPGPAACQRSRDPERRWSHAGSCVAAVVLIMRTIRCFPVVSNLRQGAIED